MTPFPIRIETTPASFPQVEADWLVVFVFDDPATDTDLQPLTAEVTRLREAGDFAGKHLELLTLRSPVGVAAKRVLLVGLGSPTQLSRRVVSAASAASLRSITGKKFARIAVALPRSIGSLEPASGLLGVVVGGASGCFGPGVRKREPSRYPPDALVLVGKVDETILSRAQAEAAAVVFARELVNLPPNDLHPESFAEIVRNRRGNLDCEVWDEERLRTERMGAILGVGQASTRPPRLLVLRHRGGGDASPIAFVGKGVTFDSGGLSLKTNDQMVDMKCDMAGGAAVAAALVALGEMDALVNAIGLVPLVENMPGGRAMKLGDVLTARDGRTIEVLNTDAEGRLILADALAYATELKPWAIVDLATLTGACMVALGTEIAGLMTNDEALGTRVREAATRAGERVWPLPMDADFSDLIKSDVADCKNVGPHRYAGAIVAAKFLEPFVAGRPWVHLDIAGPAWADHESPVRDSGGTGAFVSTLIETALSK